jgi:hypothetical protein
VISSVVDTVVDFHPESVAVVLATRFGILYNLDKEHEAYTIAS